MNIRRDTGRKLFLSLSLSSIAFAAIGCGAQTPVPRDARAAGEWTFRLPETRSPYAGLAIAHGTGEPTGLSMVDDALAETPKPATKPIAPIAVQAKHTVVAKAEPVAAEPVAQPVAEAPAVPVQTEQLALNTPATSSGEEQRYSQREQQSQKQRDFKGGDAIVISASALVIILLVVILVLLLT